MLDPDRPVQPLDVAVHVDRRQMRILWSDAHDAVYDFEYLRWRCPCAECAGEGSLPGKLASTKALTAQQTDLVDLQVVGRYGFTPVWGDGHATGIYTFRNLRALCQCPSCAPSADPVRE
jgi:ATP-binding protein involved in chromosome partitioning